MVSINEKGKITVGFGSDEQRELKVIDYVRAVYKDNRIVSISEIEDGSMIGIVQSDRAEQAQIWLSKESYIALLATSFLYFQCKREDLLKMIEQSIDSKDLRYYFSDNLQPFEDAG